MARRVIVVDDTDPRFWDPRYTADRLSDEYEPATPNDEYDDLDGEADGNAEDSGWYADGWRGFPTAKPRLPADGVKAVSQRGAMASSWWSRRFLAAIESPATGGRLTRGRSYARSGQVLSLTVMPGNVLSRVQGSRRQPYDVVLSLPLFRDADWKRIVVALTEQAAFSAALLAGELPQNMEEALKQLGLSLFPSPAQLRMSCSCPDWGNPCKHAAAVCYILAEQFDSDPFTMLTLRGMAREPLLAAIRAHRTARGEVVVGLADSHGDDSELSGFWDGGDIPPLPTTDDVTAHQVLRRLGTAGVVIRGSDLTDVLLPAYEAMVRHTWE